jgi:hypothetical protein
MCTVTFVPILNGVVLTSSRDEHESRLAADPPRLLRWGGADVAAPIDRQKGGSWVAVKASGAAMVLLNGAFEAHTAGQVYRQSRGVIFKQIFEADGPVFAFRQMDLAGVEPFTLVIFDGWVLFDCRWNGIEKQIMPCDDAKAHIWSSATLYGPDARAKRAGWFGAFLRNTPYPSAAACFQFHVRGGEGDAHDAILMRRPTGHATVSITSLILTPHRATMHYWDQNYSPSAAETTILPLALAKGHQPLADYAAPST